MARRKTEAKKALHALLFDGAAPASLPKPTPTAAAGQASAPAPARPAQTTQQAQHPAPPQSLPSSQNKEAAQAPALPSPASQGLASEAPPAAALAPAKPSLAAQPRATALPKAMPGSEKTPGPDKVVQGKSEAATPVVPAAPENAAAQIGAAAPSPEKLEPVKPEQALPQPEGAPPPTPSAQTKKAQAPKKPSLSQDLGLLRAPGGAEGKKGTPPVAGRERVPAAEAAVPRSAQPLVRANATGPEVLVQQPEPAPAVTPVGAPPASHTAAPAAPTLTAAATAASSPVVPPPAVQPTAVLKASLLDLLLHHMRQHQFTASDVEQASALVELVDKHPKMCTELAEWVVLHKEGPVLAHVTCERELPRVGKKGDTALAVWLLRLLAQEPVPVPLLQAARRSTPDVFAGVSHLVMLQAMGRGLLERSLREGYPQALLERLLQEWASLPELASASIAKRQALALEVLGSTWAFGYDEAKSHAYALPTLQRLLTQRAPH